MKKQTTFKPHHNQCPECGQRYFQETIDKVVCIPCLFKSYEESHADEWRENPPDDETVLTKLWIREQKEREEAYAKLKWDLEDDLALAAWEIECLKKDLRGFNLDDLVALANPALHGNSELSIRTYNLLQEKLKARQAAEDNRRSATDHTA